VVTDPVVRHLTDGNVELGAEVIRLAQKQGVPLTFDLLRMTPDEARLELAHRNARACLARNQ
jgi:hypothetical protein